MSKNREAAAAAAVLFASNAAAQPMDTHAVTLRLPLDDYCDLSAMAQIAGVSKSAMAIRAIAAGMVAIKEHIPEEIVDQINELSELMLEAYVEEDSPC